MTTSTFYADTSDGYVQSLGTSALGISQAFAIARNGTGSKSVNTTLELYTNNDVSLDTWTGDYTATVRQPHFLFTTSDIPDADTVSSATLSLYLAADNTAEDHILRVRTQSWGATLETTDYDTSYAGTLLATLDTSTLSINQYYNFTSESGFPAAVSKTATTEMVMSPSTLELNDPPSDGVLQQSRWYSANEIGTTIDPKLVVVHSEPAAPATPIGIPWIEVP